MIVKSKEHVLVNIDYDELRFQNISKSGKLDFYLTSKEYDKLFYEFEYASIVLIFEASLDEEIKEMIQKYSQKQLFGN